MENSMTAYAKREWNYAGHEYSFDISDSVCMKRMNEALDVLHDAYALAEADKASHQAYEEIDRVCGMIGEFFGAVFGKEAVADICGEGCNIEAYMGAYVDFIMFVNDQLESLARFREEVEKRVTEKFASRISNLAGDAGEGA